MARREFKFVGKNIPTSINEEVRVRIKETDGEDGVFLVNAPSKI